MGREAPAQYGSFFLKRGLHFTGPMLDNLWSSVCALAQDGDGLAPSRHVLLIAVMPLLMISSTVCQSPHDKLWSNPRQACSLLCKRWSEQLTKVEMVQIGIAGAFGVRTSNMATKEHHILPVSISMQGASCIVSLGSLHIEPPPYRIVNR